jgi:serine/threonine-protein kinase
MSVGGEDDTLAGGLPTQTGGGLSESELVAGRYRIVRFIGGGGMGRVYEVHDTELDERVALKVLKANIEDNAIERFRREVKLTRRIQHRNVARMFDIGEHEQEKFLTMELVDGEPLTRFIGRDPMPWPKLRAIAEQICAGLAAAHAAGVVHRDLKPDNVLLERDTERAVITDFGIARGGDQDGSVTQVGAVVGTPRYMAPEQLAGREVDARADLFSLGVMLFELATGTRPWPGDNAVAIAIAQATNAPASISTGSSEIPPAFVATVAACLRLDPAQRPTSAEAIGAAIASGNLDALDRDRPATRALRPSKPLLPKAIAQPATPTVAEPTSIAVLPLQCAPGDEYLADSLLEDITDGLSTTTGLRVRPAGIVRSLASPDPRELGRKLQVDHVAAGALRRTPTGLRLNVRLIGVAEGFQVWAHKINFSEGETLAVGESLVRDIAAALSTRATGSSTRPTDPRAVELYLRARAEQRRFWSPHQSAAADLLEKAAEYAPTSGPILGAYAHATVLAWVLRGLPDMAERARDALQRGLATGHGEAYLASAQYHFNQGEFERGGRDLGIALLRAPMSAPAHELAGNILSEIEGQVAARHHFEIAVGLDPGRTHVISSYLTRLDALDGNYEAADRRIEELVANSDVSVSQIGRIMEARLAGWRGRREQVVAAARNFTTRMGGGVEELTELITTGLATGNIDAERWAHAWLRYEGERDRPVRQQLMGIQLITEILVMIGKPDSALDTLETAARTGLMDLLWLDACPMFAPLSTNPRFRSVRAKVADRATMVLAAFHAAGA